MDIWNSSVLKHAYTRVTQSLSYLKRRAFAFRLASIPLNLTRQGVPSSCPRGGRADPSLQWDIIWRISSHEASPEVTSCHENRDGLLRDMPLENFWSMYSRFLLEDSWQLQLSPWRRAPQLHQRYQIGLTSNAMDAEPALSIGQNRFASRDGALIVISHTADTHVKPSRLSLPYLFPFNIQPSVQFQAS